MRTVKIGETKVGNQAVIISHDPPDKAFRGVPLNESKRKIELESPWIRLTGSAINEVAPETIITETDWVLDEWLPPLEAGRLAIARGVVMAFPPGNQTDPEIEPRAWQYLILGPSDSRLSEVDLPQPA